MKHDKSYPGNSSGTWQDEENFNTWAITTDIDGKYQTAFIKVEAAGKNFLLYAANCRQVHMLQ